MIIDFLSYFDAALLMRYLAVFFILVFMEGLLSADNALVLAVMVRPLPENHRNEALFYGLIGAFVMRFGALFIISYLANIWQAQAVGAVYLLYVAAKNLHAYAKKEEAITPETVLKEPVKKEYSRKVFWLTVAKVELADIAFAVDSILAAVAIAMSLPPLGHSHIGGFDTGRFLVVFLGGLAGLILMRFAATVFVKLLDRRPKLEKAAFILVGWVGIKLIVVTLAHPAVGIIAEDFPHSIPWQIIFFGTMAAIAVWGWVSSAPEKNHAE